ncbi:MAG: HlyD family type I secretion periplasmic adaptor subunit [Thalassobaculaceae bacterium]|nr:HlyD family type I secretion periplasmic adaptor subunit [Thalassobaculaceae bacterium]
MSIVEQGGLVPKRQGGLIDLDPYESIAASAVPKWHRGMALGYSIMFLFFGVFGAFAALAPLQSSVIAAGTIRVDREPRIVQHPSGGMIKELLVREGQHVHKGDKLIVLDPTRGNAEREILRKRYFGGLITQARLEAERRGEDSMELPPEILDRADDPTIMEMIESEQSLLASRMAARGGEVELIHELMAQTRTGIGASQERLASLDEEIRLIDEELVNVQELYAKGLERLSRVRALERTRASLKGSRSMLVGDIAGMRQRLSELDIRILQSGRQQEAQVATQLDAVARQIRESGQQLPVTEQMFDQLDIRAPESGRVLRLAVNTKGAVISGGQVLMEIVPDDEELVVIARVNPKDIDSLTKDIEHLKVTVRLTAFSQRFTHPVEGELIQVSPDVIQSDKGSPYYRVDIRLNKDSLDHILEGQHLVSGMPAMALLGVGERTLLTYLMDPLIRSFQKALREP